MCENIWNVNFTYNAEEFASTLKKLINLADALAPRT